MNDMPVRIVIADSHEIIRDGISNILTAECDVEIVGHAVDGYGTIKQCRMFTPDVLLMDIDLLNPSGMATFEKVRATAPNIKIIVLSSDASASEAYLLLSKGAAGFMPKQATGAHFVNALNTVSMGYACISAECLQGFVSLRRNASRTGNIYGLSPREVEVLEHCRSGARTKEIASKLQISVRTVETHRNSIYRKTSTHSMDELASVAVGL
jgi:DNA-binding NarL/FixJ family response regulator